MNMAGGPLEAHERFYLHDRAQAETRLGALFEGGQAVLPPDQAVVDCILHRFRLGGIAGFAVHALSPLTLTIRAGRYLACAATRLAVEIDQAVSCDAVQAAILAPHRSHQFHWPAGGVLLGCLASPEDMARYGAVASAASGRGFGADGVMLLDFTAGPFRALGGGMRLVADALRLDPDPAADIPAAPDASVPAAVPRHVKRAEDYLARHLAEPLTMAELASRVGVSVRSLHRGFLDFRGVTPARYVQNLRIEAAHRLMISGSCFMDLRQVAAEVGFGSYAPFWRAYVRRYGRPPSTTRRTNGGDHMVPDGQPVSFR